VTRTPVAAAESPEEELDEFVEAPLFDLLKVPLIGRFLEWRHARTLLQVADQDGNGALDAGEYTRLAAVYGARADEAERAFGQLDQDSNGVLDTAELTLAISQFFTSRDPESRGNVAFGHL